MSKLVRKPPPAMEDMVLVAGGEVDEYHIALRFFGDDLDPDRLTELLGAKPTSACRKGDLFKGRVSQRVEKQGKWLLAMPERPGEEFEAQVDALLDGLTSDLGVWRQLSAKYNGDLFCGAWVRSWNRGMELSPSLLAKLAERGLTLGLDIYVDNDDD